MLFNPWVSALIRRIPKKCLIKNFPNIYLETSQLQQDILGYTLNSRVTRPQQVRASIKLYIVVKQGLGFYARYA